MVFIASPGDCEDERGIVRAVADSVTQAVGTQIGVRVRVEGWESVAPDFGRPQEQINRLVDDCDIFVGLLGHRWGTYTGTHSSGFLEEFERAVQRRASGDAPHIAMYFRQPPPVMAADPGPELTKVLDFQQRIRDEHVLLYRTFHDAGDFERQLWPMMSQLALAVGAPARHSAADATSAGAAAPESSTEDLQGDDMDDARRQIAATTDGVTQLVRGVQSERSLDRDRLLLVSLALNDDAGLVPVHVANRLYSRREELVLSVMEDGIWLRSLIADTGTSASPIADVIPGYAILRPAETDLLDLLDDENDDVVRGVFRILLRLLRRPDPLWRPDDLDLAACAAKWAAALGRPSVAAVVQTYLAAVSTPDDLALLGGILAVEASREVQELSEALSGQPLAMATAVSRGVYEPDWKVIVLTEILPSADDETVRTLATGRNTPSTLRGLAALELHKRGGLTEDLLGRLLLFPSVVDLVFEWAVDDGSSVMAEQLGRAVAQLDKDTPNRSDLESRARAATSTTADLLTGLDAGDDALRAWDALEWKDDLGLVDRAREIFDTDADPVVAQILDSPAWRDRADLIDFVRSQSRLGALRILRRQHPFPAEDRARLRREVERGSLHRNEECLVWLAEVSTPDDLTLLLSTLPRTYGETTTKVAEAILRVGGRDGVNRLLELGERDQAVLAVKALGRDPACELNDLQELLYSPVAEVRLAALEQIVEHSDRSELLALLNEYPKAKERYFYNVVCELDWLLFAFKNTAESARGER